MTRTAPRPVRIDCHAQADHAETGAWGITLVWDLAARVCQDLSPDSDTPTAAELVITPHKPPSGCEADRADAELRLILRSGARQTLRALTNRPCAWSDERAYRHLDMPGVFACTLGHDGDTRPIYARCELFEPAGIPAGSYALRGTPA